MASIEASERVVIQPRKTVRWKFHKLINNVPWKRLTIPLALTLLSFLSFRNVFFNDETLAFEDLSPMYKLEQLHRPFDFPWDDKSNLGAPNFNFGNAVYNVLLIFFSVTFRSVTLGHKFLFVFLLTAAGYGFYLFCKYLIDSRFGGFVAALYYMYNPWIYHHITYGHNTIFCGYAVFPFALLYYFKSFKEPRLENLLVGAAVSSLLFLANIHLSYLFFMVAAFHAITQALSERRKKIDSLLSLVPAVAIFALFASFSFPIIYYIYEVRIPVLLVRKDMISTYMRFSSMEAAHLIIGGFAVGSSLLLTKRDRTKAFFLLLCGVGFALGLLGWKPLRPIFALLFDIVPGFPIFRATNKFFLLSVASLAFLLGDLSRTIVSKWSSARRGRVLKAAFVAVLILLTVAPSLKLFNGDYAGAVKTVKVPRYYVELDSWLRRQEGDFRVAFLPPAAWATKYNWSGHWFLDPLVSLQAKPTVELRSDMDVTLSGGFVKWIYTAIYANKTSNWSKLLGILGVKYVIVRPDVETIRSEGGHLFTVPKTLNLLPNEEGLKYVRSFGPLLVYENENYLPHVFASNEISIIAGSRNVLIALSELESFNFRENPVAFLDNDVSFQEMLPNIKLLIMEEDRYLDLLINWVKDKQVIKPWEILEPSTDALETWVRGDYSAFLYGGELNIAPDNYVLTLRRNNSFSASFSIMKEGNYELFVQILGSPNKEFNGVKLAVDGGNETFIETKTNETRLKWVKVGNYRLSEGSHSIRVTSVESAAVSKIVLIPAETKRTQEESMLSAVQNSNVTPVHILRNASSFRVIKSGNYVLYLETARGDRKCTPKVDEAPLNLLATKAEAGVVKYWFGPVKLEQGSHKIMVNLALNYSILYYVKGENPMALPWSPETEPPSISYVKSSGSIYELKPKAAFVIFLEAHTRYWRLNHQQSPITILGYANAFKIEKPLNENYAIIYLGLEHVKRGAMASLILSLTTITVCYYLLKTKNLLKKKKVTSSIHT